MKYYHMYFQFLKRLVRYQQPVIWNQSPILEEIIESNPFIHPFSDGNGRMADCGTQLFYRNGNRYLNIFQLIVKLEVKIWHTVSW